MRKVPFILGVMVAVAGLWYVRKDGTSRGVDIAEYEEGARNGEFAPSGSSSGGGTPAAGRALPATTRESVAGAFPPIRSEAPDALDKRLDSDPVQDLERSFQSGKAQRILEAILRLDAILTASIPSERSAILKRLEMVYALGISSLADATLLVLFGRHQDVTSTRVLEGALGRGEPFPFFAVVGLALTESSSPSSGVAREFWTSFVYDQSLGGSLLSEQDRLDYYRAYYHLGPGEPVGVDVQLRTPLPTSAFRSQIHLAGEKLVPACFSYASREGAAGSYVTFLLSLVDRADPLTQEHARLAYLQSSTSKECKRILLRLMGAGPDGAASLLGVLAEESDPDLVNEALRHLVSGHSHQIELMRVLGEAKTEEHPDRLEAIAAGLMSIESAESYRMLLELFEGAPAGTQLSIILNMPGYSRSPDVLRSMEEILEAAARSEHREVKTAGNRLLSRFQGALRQGD